MSHNPNFYNNFRGNNCTFQRLPSYSLPPPPLPPPHFVPPPALPPPHYVPPPPHFVPQAPQQYVVPPPPQPPPFFIPSATPAAKREKADQDFLSTFEDTEDSNPAEDIQPEREEVRRLSITYSKELLRDALLAVLELHQKQAHLAENMGTLTPQEWHSRTMEIAAVKAQIGNTLYNITGPYIINIRTAVARRKAKRLRLKRLHLEKKREKEERLKELKERSRKIDENLQKIKDDIKKAKQEEEDKLQADMVLKEVLRKKTDAKKCLTKLDALVNLRKARQNTAAGRGETVSENEAAAFQAHIDKLKSLWEVKLVLYEKEEADLCAQLKRDSEEQSALAERETNVAGYLAQWREVLFGGQLPQVDFGGDVARFLEVRSQWDRYISSEGTVLPIGWVTPTPIKEEPVRE
ncbi:hypothetical protein PYW07_002558 [Mythimna separata]|uniref:Programmed cell death protein 7 n=1 Tax=Mythimna separata TaxID=271217 RepID=A0AAD7YGH7_MYTSE|nr:hypothetical protein PYW07_002558 [Mythimna separata]